MKSIVWFGASSAWWPSTAPPAVWLWTTPLQDLAVRWQQGLSLPVAIVLVLAMGLFYRLAPPAARWQRALALLTGTLVALAWLLPWQWGGGDC